MRGLLYADGCFPFCVKEKDQNGNPFQEWDGVTVWQPPLPLEGGEPWILYYDTYYGENLHIPSGSSEKFVDVIGDGSIRPIGFTREQLAEFVWRADELEYTATHIERVDTTSVGVDTPTVGELTAPTPTVIKPFPPFERRVCARYDDYGFGVGHLFFASDSKHYTTEDVVEQNFVESRLLVQYHIDLADVVFSENKYWPVVAPYMPELYDIYGYDNNLYWAFSRRLWSGSLTERYAHMRLVSSRAPGTSGWTSVPSPIEFELSGGVKVKGNGRMWAYPSSDWSFLPEGILPTVNIKIKKWLPYGGIYDEDTGARV